MRLLALLEPVGTGTEMRVGAVVEVEVASGGPFIVSCEGNVADGTGIVAGAVAGASEVVGNTLGINAPSKVSYKSSKPPAKL